MTRANCRGNHHSRQKSKRYSRNCRNCRNCNRSHWHFRNDPHRAWADRDRYSRDNGCNIRRGSEYSARQRACSRSLHRRSSHYYLNSLPQKISPFLGITSSYDPGKGEVPTEKSASLTLNADLIHPRNGEKSPVQISILPKSKRDPRAVTTTAWGSINQRSSNLPTQFASAMLGTTERATSYRAARSTNTLSSSPRFMALITTHFPLMLESMYRTTFWV